MNMTNRLLTEKRVLEQLDIPNFRYMTKDKVINLASMLPYMDPEVAMKALEQFTNFEELATQLVTEYKFMLDSIIQNNSNSQTEYFNACNSILEALKYELMNGELSFEDRVRIESNMILVGQMIGEKDRENKQFLLKIAAVVCITITGIVGAAVSLLGSNVQASAPRQLD